MIKATHTKIDAASIANHLHYAIAGEHGNIADAVATVVNSFDGKIVNQKFLDALPFPEHIKWRTGFDVGGYRKLIGEHAAYTLTFYLSDKDTKRIQAERFEKDNPPYFSGRRERNAVRNLLLADEDELLQAGCALENLRLSRLALEAAQKVVDKFFSKEGYFQVRSNLISMAQQDDGTQY